jgi:hypothetical protein
MRPGGSCIWARVTGSMIEAGFISLGYLKKSMAETSRAFHTEDQIFLSF